MMQGNAARSVVSEMGVRPKHFLAPIVEGCTAGETICGDISARSAEKKPHFGARFAPSEANTSIV